MKALEARGARGGKGRKALETRGGKGCKGARGANFFELIIKKKLSDVVVWWSLWENYR